MTDAIATALSLGPALRARAPEGISARRLPEATVRDMQESGLFRLLQPARWGGSEADPLTFYEAQAAIARACPSTAWVMGVFGVHFWQLALFPEETQQEVWGEDPATLISSSYMPVGKVTTVPGGYRLTGRWAFSSGSDHCRWAFLGAFVPNPTGPPDMRTFLVPRVDYSVLDTWNVSGLQATGSNDIVVEDAFVPEHHTLSLLDGFTGRSPGLRTNPGPLYRLPFGQIFVRAISTTALGIAEGALAEYRAGIRDAVGRLDGTRLGEDAVAQANCARSSVLLHEVRRSLRDCWAEMGTHVAAGERIPVEDRLRYRYESALACVKCVEVVDLLFTAAAARAVALDSPLQRYFQDIHVARAHYANNPDKPARNFGLVELGGRNVDYFL